MKPFMKRILICLLPVVIAGIMVGMAVNHYQKGEGGFKLGVDLVGGTILVYEVDTDKPRPENYQPEELAAALKRRIDPTDLYNVLIRALSDTRVEIILPTGGAHQANIEEQHWQALLEAIQAKWPELAGVGFDVPRGQQRNLAVQVQQKIESLAWTDLLKAARAKWPDKLKGAELDKITPGNFSDVRAALNKAGVPEAEISAFADKEYKSYQGRVVTDADVVKFIDDKYQPGRKRKDVTGEEVQRIKELIKQVGSLEFRILANTRDDTEATRAAQVYIDAQSDPREPEEKQRERKAELERRAARGLPPPPPRPAEGSEFAWSTGQQGSGTATYSWVELGRQERRSLNLDNNAAKVDSGRSQRWQEVAKARDQGRALVLFDFGDTLIYSRKCINYKLPPEEQALKQFEYFVLVRDPKPDEKITGQYLTDARQGTDQSGLGLVVNFAFNTQGGNLFYAVTSQNRPSGGEGSRFFRHLAIILDDQIVSAPQLNEAIRNQGQISGKFTKEEVDRLVSILRAGALPATLKPEPVSENTIGPTLGAQTIRAGTLSVLWAFVAVLAFMVVYYRFSGLVACIALFANLLLTIGFMVMVNATFTLPGLAGLVLMLAMAVDANVLIYERLREERERGASLALAIRNGYDRAFPTIIDTHLTSILTAIILYAVGNDQLKGFGISLTVGLIISLFTSLYMTRLIFDIWQSQGWLHKLSMAKLLSNPHIDFMRIRYYWFTATILLTVLGVTVFLIRGKQGLNIDFVGGTAYGGQLKQPIEIGELRRLLGEQSQQQRLVVDRVVEDTASEGTRFAITFRDPEDNDKRETLTVVLPNRAEGATREERERSVAARAQGLPDWSVEQIFLSGESGAGNQSRLFTVRTSEKAPDLVQLTMYRLLNKEGEPLLKQVVMENFKVGGKAAALTFAEKTADGKSKAVEASPGQVKMLIEREAKQLGLPETLGFDVIGEGRGKEGRFQTMRLEVTGTTEKLTEDNLKTLLTLTQTAFAARPQPERLENFDSQLAQDTQRRALYAILGSWGAILLYLWFRFGNWTFGLAAVLCLIHDLLFTMGIIAFCHYIDVGMPALAHALALQDFKIDLPAVAALLTLVGYSVNDTIVVFDRVREVRGKNPELTPQMINDSVNQTLSRTLLTSFITWLTVIVLYIWGGDGVHLFAFVMVVGVVVGTYSSIYIASPLLLIFGEGKQAATRQRQPEPEPAVPEKDE